MLSRALSAAVVVLMMAAAPSSASPNPYVIFGNVEAGAEVEGGTSWFDTWNEGMRFVMQTTQPERREALWALLHRSNQEGRGLTVRFDGSQPRFNAAARRFEYAVCSVELEEIRVEPEASCRPGGGGEGKSAEGRVGRALAEVHAGTESAAISLLNEALQDRELPLPVHQIALKTRAQAQEALAYQLQPESAAADRALVAALSDYRALARLNDDADVQLAIGWLLEQLGDYTAARSTYERALARWPDEDFRVTLRLAALARTMGDAQRSLDLINAMVERHGSDLGMRFHYHRGWTLIRLGRFDEAVADFTAGLEAQPDYSWAYLRRGCARAMLGMLSDAIADLDQGAALLRKLPAAAAAKSTRHDIDRATAIVAELKVKAASGASQAVPSACTGYWNDPEQPRGRSPLLPAS